MDLSIQERILYHKEQALYHEKEIRVLKYQNYYQNDIEKNILKDVAKKHWVWVEEIMQKNAFKQIMPARREVVKILRDEYNYWFERIGELLWKKHASILYLYKT